MKKTVYLFDENNAFAGEYKAQESPLEPGVFLAPIRSTEVVPPTVTRSQYAQWNNSSWVIVDIPDTPVYVPTQEEIEAENKLKQETQEVKADNKFQNLINKTPTQVKNWVESSFPSLTLPEKKDLTTIVQSIVILARNL